MKMDRLLELMRNNFELVAITTGAVLASFGFWLAWAPLGFIAAGAALIWMGYPEE